MLRHDLYDVDRALSATATYALVTGALLAVYPRWSSSRGCCSAATRPSAAVAATALCAVALAPLRTRLQRRVDRRLYPARGRRWPPIDDLRRARRRRAGAPGASCGDRAARPRCAIRSCASATGCPGRRRPGRRGRRRRRARIRDGAVPVCWGGAEIGVLCGGVRGARALLRGDRRRRPRCWSRWSRLRLELAAALREVESSRARLLQAGYAGAPPARARPARRRPAAAGLAGHGAAARAAPPRRRHGRRQRAARPGRRRARTAVAELRQIAHGLRPSSLDDGLGPALRRLATAVPIPVELDV